MSGYRPDRPEQLDLDRTAGATPGRDRIEHPVTHVHLQSLALAIRAAGLRGRAAFLDGERARLVNRQRSLRQALNTDDGSAGSARMIGHALTRLFRALAEYQELHPVIEDDLFALRDSYLRALADRSELTVLESSGSIRDFAGEAQAERELARTILHETTLAWSTLRASPDRATAAAYQLEKLSGERFGEHYWQVATHEGPADGSDPSGTLPVPFVYRTLDGCVIFIPAGSTVQLRHGAHVLETRGAILRTGNTLVLAGAGEIQLNLDRLAVASGTQELFAYASELAMERDTPVSLLAADKIQVDHGIRLSGVGIVQGDPATIVGDADWLLYASDAHAFGLELTPPLKDLIASPSLRSESFGVLQTLTNASGDRDTVLHLTAVTLQDGNELLELETGELRLTDTLDGKARYRITTQTLSGRLGDYTTLARGRSTVDVQLAANGEIATLSVSNPATLSLSRDDQHLAVTDGRVSLHHQSDGRTTRAIDALKATIEEGEDTLTVELGRLSLTRSESGAGRTQMTGKAFRGRYKGIEMSGDDVGLEVTIDSRGVPVAVQSTGRAMTLGDGTTEISSNDASLEASLGPGRRFSRLIHQAGLTELGSAELGTLTLRGHSTLDLSYDGDRVSQVRADAEELSWTQRNGSQLDMRDAAAVLDLDEQAARRRASLETGTLAWRGADGLEVTTFGTGAQVDLSETGKVLETLGGLEGMTVRTRGGIAQVDRGRLVARYDRSGNFQQATVNAGRLSFYANNNGVFDLEDGVLTVGALDDGGSRTHFEAARVQHDRGSENLFLDRAEVVLEQRDDGTATLDADYEAGQLSTARAEFELSPGSELFCEFDGQGLVRVAGDITAASYLDGDERLTLTDGYFDGSFDEGAIASFDADGAITYGRVDGLSFVTKKAELSASELEDGGREFIVTGLELSASDGKRRFDGAGASEIRFELDRDGTVERTTLRGERFIVQDGDRRVRFDGNEVSFSSDGDVHLADGSLQIYRATELVEEIAGRDSYLTFADSGHLQSARLLGDESLLAGAFGTIRLLEERVSAEFADGKIQSVNAVGGEAHVALRAGLEFALEQSQSALNYDDEHNPTLSVESGRALLTGEYGRLILPEGFELQACRRGNILELEGSTPNSSLDDTQVRAVNSFNLKMTLNGIEFSSMSLTGTANLDHPTRRVRLHGGELVIQYNRSDGRLVYRGDSSSLELIHQDVSLKPGAGLALGDSLTARVDPCPVEICFADDALAHLRSDRITMEITVRDRESKTLDSLVLPELGLHLCRESDGSTRLSGKPVAETKFAFAGTDFELGKVEELAVHLAADGGFAANDGLVVRTTGPTMRGGLEWQATSEENWWSFRPKG